MGPRFSCCRNLLLLKYVLFQLLQLFSTELEFVLVNSMNIFLVNILNNLHQC